MALGTAGFTAALAIIRMERNGLTPGNGPVVVSGATGGVGSIAIAALARLGYHVVAFTGKSEEDGYLGTLGAAEVMPRSSVDLARLKPLGRATWAAGVDNLGGNVLAWMASTMKVNGVIASIGLAESSALNTTVMPFILRGVSLLGINSSESPDPLLRREAWRRLSVDMKPPMLETIAQTITFAELPTVFERFIAGQVRGRIVVRIDG
jgi:putative YhdH/YhfP family quinone oxidoreductase